MRLGKLVFNFTNTSILSDYLIDEITIDTGIMRIPRIRFHGTSETDGIALPDPEYNFTLRYDDIEWNSVFTPEDNSNPTKDGQIIINGILAPYDLSLGKSSGYYRSIYEVISTLCAGWIDPDNYDPPTLDGFYNQQGENNLDYVFKVGSMAYAGSIPAFTHEGFRFVDFHNDIPKYDLTQLGGTLDNSGSVLNKSPKTYKPEVDLFEVKTTSNNHYGTMREGMNIQIISSDYFEAFRAKSINDQLLEDSERTIQITFSDFAPCKVGDSIIYEVDHVKRIFMITSANWVINQGGPITRYKLFLIG